MENIKQKVYITFFTLGIVMFLISLVTFVIAYGIYKENDQLQSDAIEIGSTVFRLEHLTSTLNYFGHKHIISENKEEMEVYKDYLIAIHAELDDVIEEVVATKGEKNKLFYEQFQIKWELFYHYFYTAIQFSEENNQLESQMWFIRANEVFEELNTDYLLPLYKRSYRYIAEYVEKQSINNRHFTLLEVLFLLITITCFVATWYYLKKVVRNSEQLSERLQFLAYHDDLTELPNRRYFKKIVNTAIEKAENFAIMYLDIDKFKSINDQYGHETGDRVIQAFANKIKGSLGEMDILGRIGGDEFTIFVKDYTSKEEVMVLATKIVQSFQQPSIIDGNEFQISTSIGIAFYPRHGKDYEAVLRRADQALYKAKLTRSSFVIYREE